MAVAVAAAKLLKQWQRLPFLLLLLQWQGLLVALLRLLLQLVHQLL